jgi:hypothetical protein
MRQAHGKINPRLGFANREIYVFDEKSGNSRPKVVDRIGKWRLNGRIVMLSKHEL